ncbi:hypothetical protein LIER_43700 [Lithospermum erythrorhizon]|uniref:Uncharacterized protein n=1 Tax=Lithospermum erythrorhizon TaxID=34254 RepID=A0AAV3QQN9_LITER
MYILCNTSEVTPFLVEYHDMIEDMYPDLTSTQRDQMVNNTFIEHFKNYVAQNKYNIDQRLITLSLGPRREINIYKWYYTNDNDNILVVPDLYDVEDGGQAVRFEKQNVSDGESDDDDNDNEEDDY